MRWIFLVLLALVFAVLIVGSAFHYVLFREPPPDPALVPLAGDVIESSILGDRITFRKTSNETEEQLVAVDVRLIPGGELPAHTHPGQEERIVIRRGEVSVRVDGVENQAARGDTVVIPGGAAHHVVNYGNEDARFTLEVTPGGQFDAYLVQFHGFAAQDTVLTKTDTFFQMALFSQRYNVYRADSPVLVQKVLSFLLAPTARVLGFHSYYPEYQAIATKRGRGS